MVIDSQDIVDDAVVLHAKLVAQDRRVPELFHQWRSELLEGVAEQNHLVVVAQPVEKLAGSVERSHVGEHRPQIAHRDPFSIEDLESVGHEPVVVGLVASGALEFVDPGTERKIDPNLGDQYAFDIESHHLLRTAADGSCRA